MSGEVIVIWLKWFVALAGACLSWLLGGWDLALQILVIFVIFDYLTGVVAAWHEKKLDSNIGLFGIAKKILLFIPVAIGYWLDQFTGQEILRNIAIFFYMANEALSILENLGRCGVAIPPALLDALQQLKKNRDHPEQQEQRLNQEGDG